MIKPGGFDDAGGGAWGQPSAGREFAFALLAARSVLGTMVAIPYYRYPLHRMIAAHRRPRRDAAQSRALARPTPQLHAHSTGWEKIRRSMAIPVIPPWDVMWP